MLSPLHRPCSNDYEAVNFDFHLAVSLFSRSSLRLSSLIPNYCDTFSCKRRLALSCNNQFIDTLQESGSDEDVNRRQWEADKPLSERLKVNCSVMIDKKISVLKFLSDFVGSYRSTCALSVISGHRFFSPSSDYFRQSRVVFDFLGTCSTTCFG